MYKQISLILVLLLVACQRVPISSFTYAEPETKAYSSQKLELLREHLELSGASSMMILVDGDVIFEWGNTSHKHTIHSMRKALLNSLVGLAVEQGKIDTSLTLKELGITDIDPGLSAGESEARIADLLKSRSGVYHHAAAVSTGMLLGMPERNTYVPGEHYYYNNWDFNTMGAILEMQTGKSIYKLFKDQIAKPLGMKDYKGRFGTIDGESEDSEIPDADGFYQYEKSKSKYPAYHFRMSTCDLLLYGQLYLNYGSWDGEQIVSREWIDASTYPYSVYNQDYGLAYGMLWNVIIPDENTERNSFFHTGAGIHMLGVYPDLNMVFVHRVDTENKSDYNQADLYKMLDLLFSSGIEE